MNAAANSNRHAILKPPGKEDKNTLRFWRDRAPQFGVALKSFTLKPSTGR